MMVNKFASERVQVAHGDGPLQDGLYVAEVYFGWKLLEWKDGAWWHPSAVGRWTANAPVQWVGPMPERLCVEKGRKPTEQVFDL